MRGPSNPHLPVAGVLPGLAIGIFLATFALGPAAFGGEVAGSPEAVVPVAVGERAPLVTLRDVDGKPAPLGDHVGRGPILLVFYRGGW